MMPLCRAEMVGSLPWECMLGEHEDRASQAGYGDEQGVELAALLEY